MASQEWGECSLQLELGMASQEWGQCSSQLELGMASQEWGQCSLQLLQLVGLAWHQGLGMALHQEWWQFATQAFLKQDLNGCSKFPSLS